jgi:hypothetical protein
MQCTDLKEGTLRQEKIHDLVGKRKMVNWGKKAYPAKILNVGMPAKGSKIASVLLIYHLITFRLQQRPSKPAIRAAWSSARQDDGNDFALVVLF